MRSDPVIAFELDEPDADASATAASRGDRHAARLRVDPSDHAPSPWGQIAGALAVEGRPPALTFKASVFGTVMNAGVLENVGYAETGAAAPDKNNDNGFDEVAWVHNAINASLFADPAGVDCFNAKTPTFGPTTSLTTGAVTPPNDGFFDATATYVGAFKDANDKWATTGKWVSWDSQ